MEYDSAYLDDDPELALALPVARKQAYSQVLRRPQRALPSMPGSGVETPPPQPGTDPRTPTPTAADYYRSRGLEAQDAASRLTNETPDTGAMHEAYRSRYEAAGPDIGLAMFLGSRGGKMGAQMGGQILKQALAARAPQETPQGVMDYSGFTVDPFKARDQRVARLQDQAKLYEAQALHADTIEQRREAAAAADATRREAMQLNAQLRRDIAGASATRAGDRAEETRAARAFTQENQLRDDFEKQVKDQRVSIATYPQLEASLTGTPSAASDMRAIFRYMKMLDPTSVVREGEFATARNAAGIPERVANLYNRALNGTMLTPNQRKDFLGQARSERDTAAKFFNERASEFAARAQGYGLNPRNVILGYDGAGGGPPPGAVREKR